MYADTDADTILWLGSFNDPAIAVYTDSSAVT